jgi:hypothetical protein
MIFAKSWRIMKTEPQINLFYRLPLKELTCILVILLAEWLFFNEYGDTGWVMGAFCFALLVITGASNLRSRKTKSGIILRLLAFGQTLAMVEYPGMLNITLFAVFIVAIALDNKIKKHNLGSWLKQILYYMAFKCWFRFTRDAFFIAKIRVAKRKGRLFLRIFLPVSMTLAFIVLFKNANPMLESWIKQIMRNFSFRMFDEIFVFRVLFYGFIASICWALIRPKFKARAKKKIEVSHRTTLVDLVFNKNAIFSSLMIFNIMFLIQNVMDIAFIWSGAELPKGYTYAEYAHQGAYPLIATALLAAWFVLIALKPGSESGESKFIRILTYLWVGQNIFLVTSAVMRLYGYVEEYSLTYLRLSAFIWMGLVVVGLGLIIYRIYAKRSSIWLVNCNIISLISVLYITSLLNLGGFIAEYNYNSYLQHAGTKRLDNTYLCREIGIEALPILQKSPYCFDRVCTTCDNYEYVSLEEKLERKLSNWRSWTFIEYRIALETNHK